MPKRNLGIIICALVAGLLMAPIPPGSAAAPVASVGSVAVQQPLTFDYDYSTEAAIAAELDVENPDPDRLRGIFAKRRARVLQAVPEGAMLIFSVERAQD